MQLFSGTLTNILKFQRLAINSKDASESAIFSPEDAIEIRVSGESKENLPDFRITIAIFRDGIRLFSQHDIQKPGLMPKGTFESKTHIPPGILRPGEYSVAFGGYRDGMTEWIWGTDIGFFWISEEWGERNEQSNHGLINIPFNGTRTCFPGK